MDKSNKGALDLDGFKEFTMSEEANQCIDFMHHNI